MSSPLATARSLVLDRENTSTGAMTAFAAANAGLAIVHSHRAEIRRPIACPAHATRFDPLKQASQFPNRGGRKLTPPARERPGRDHRNRGPSTARARSVSTISRSNASLLRGLSCCGRVSFNAQLGVCFNYAASASRCCLAGNSRFEPAVELIYPGLWYVISDPVSSCQYTTC